jgi:sugar O-acyltransferase (sialic acid O-acetyltransferase NeuD family)
VIESTGLFKIQGIIGLGNEVGGQLMGYPICGSDDDLEALTSDGASAFVTVGQIKNAGLRRRLFLSLSDLKIDVPVLVSPLAYLSPHASLKAGAIVMHGAIINSGSRIGENCIVNSMALVEHDVTVGAHTHVATRATINGGVKVGAGCFLGSGCLVKQGVSIGDSSVIGAGSLVLSDVPANSLVVGVYND